MNVGFIGLGIMGRPMVGHLLDAGHTLYVHDLHPAPDDLLDKGATPCRSGRAVAQKAEVIITMVPDTPHVAAALFGPDGVAEGLTAGKIVVDMSSISPIETKDFARRINELGCDYLDAPVSGGEVGAKAASLTIMAGGPDKAFETVKPLFELMGKNITLVGGNGDGQTTKVANQIIVALTIEAVGEALLFASKAGADPARVRQALMGGFASSRILELHGDRMVKRAFDPGFRIELHQKDLNLALSGARALGLSLPNTATCQELFNACAAHGGKAWDHSAMVCALELMANHRIGQGYEGRHEGRSAPVKAEPAAQPQEDIKSLGYVMRLMEGASEKE
ncbi:2-hydroxy-3-oxopropionate reductase [Azospirillum sp. sgz301742]